MSGRGNSDGSAFCSVRVHGVGFCVMQGCEAASVPSQSGRYYFPIIYIIAPILLLAGMNPKGLFTWPIVTLLLLIRGHWIVGWVPTGLVLFNLNGNSIIMRKSNADKHDEPTGDGMSVQQ